MILPKKSKNPKDEKALVSKLLDYVQELENESSERIAQIEENEKWFKGDESVQWAADRPEWRPKVMANLIESNCRTKISILTDSKPKIYIYGIPPLSFVEAIEAVKTGRGPRQEESEKYEFFRNVVDSMNIAFDHIWRFNRMNSVVEQAVVYGSTASTLVGRVYWDQKAGPYGEIRIEPVNPKYVFFDKSTTRVQIEDGSLDVFVVKIPKKLSWFRHYFPGKEVKPAKDIRDKSVEGSPSNYYTEIYMVDDEVLEEEDENGLKKRKRKYPNGRLVILGGETILYDGAIPFFPYAVHPYEYMPDDYYGTNDVERQIPLNKDFNSKLAQVSLNIALSANRQFIVNPAKLGMKIDELLEHIGEPGYIFQTIKLAEDAKNAIIALDTPKFNAELFQYLYYVPVLLEEVTGIYKAVKGMAEKRERQTRYEVGKQFEAATVRIRNTAHHIELWLQDLAQIIIKAIKVYYSNAPHPIYSLDERTGSFKTNLFQYPEEAQDFEYIVSVQPETMLPVDMQSQVQRDMQLFQMGALDPITLLETIRHPDLPEIQERLKQTPPGGHPPQGNTGGPMPQPPITNR